MSIINNGKNEDEIVENTVNQEEIECSFNIPILIIGSKSDSLENLTMENELDHL